MTDALKPIRTNADLQAVLAQIADLMDAAPGTPHADRLELLAVLAADYERRALGEDPDAIEILSVAMQAQGRTQAELAAVLGSRARASEVLARRRGLSGEMVQRLSAAWSVPARLLSGPSRLVKADSPRAGQVVAGLALFLALSAGAMAAPFALYGHNLPDIGPVVDRVRGEPGYVRLEDLPPHLVQAFLSAEDAGFYDHGGYDAAALTKATARNVVGDGGRTMGGATITQQLAKSVLLQGEAKGLRRKVREILLAQRIEGALPKDRILEAWLNTLYFGGDAYGLAAASDLYFGKPVAELTVAEAAYLAGLPTAPNAYRLDRPDNLARAVERRDWVLGRMQGQGFITASAATLAKAQPLGGHSPVALSKFAPKTGAVEGVGRMRVLRTLLGAY